MFELTKANHKLLKRKLVGLKGYVKKMREYRCMENGINKAKTSEFFFSLRLLNNIC